MITNVKKHIDEEKEREFFGRWLELAKDELASRNHNMLKECLDNKIDGIVFENTEK